MPEPTTMMAVAGGLTVLATHLARTYFAMAKEVVDVILGFILAVVFLPLLGLCALIIRLSNRGPVLFVQERVGQGGKMFRMYKLRTMRVDAELGTGAVWASRSDPRVIPACRWMRRTHVDELPQLINVIKGDMSIVGPRPERPEILVQLEKTYPNVRERLAVRPGITGLAQIRSGYDTTVDAFRNKLTSDLEYIDQQRWSTELRILAATVAKFNDKQAR